ncbi:MAG: hypothetical protein JSW34_08300 [Candidatus Zixiibacteriota bacterium]|nr:MAG: hypothetical protein JSW34_08300 [candidate division Zixibacteria bacterium]
MKKGLCAALLFILALCFVASVLSVPAEAKVVRCWDACIDGFVWECCEVTRGNYTIVRCRLVNPPTPC